MRPRSAKASRSCTTTIDPDPVGDCCKPAPYHHQPPPPCSHTSIHPSIHPNSSYPERAWRALAWATRRAGPAPMAAPRSPQGRRARHLGCSTIPARGRGPAVGRPRKPKAPLALSVIQSPSTCEPFRLRGHGGNPHAAPTALAAAHWMPPANIARPWRWKQWPGAGPVARPPHDRRFESRACR